MRYYVKSTHDNPSSDLYTSYEIANVERVERDINAGTFELYGSDSKLPLLVVPLNRLVGARGTKEEEEDK